jgi:glycerol-3-phosphate dehydrogenase
MTVGDRQYILDAIHYMFPTVNVTVDDVESSWAGVRPLIFEEGKDPSEISRKDEVWEQESGLITIAGGKLTGYRKMSEHVVDLVSKRLKSDTKQVFGRSKTINLPISGADFGGSHQFNSFVEKKALEAVQFGLTIEEGRHFASFYGTNADQLFKIAHTSSGMKLEGTMTPAVYSEVVYAVQNEMMVKPVDFFIRRTGRLFFDINWVQLHKASVLKLMKDLLSWDEATYEAYQVELEKEMHDAVIALS